MVSKSVKLGLKDSPEVAMQTLNMMLTKDKVPAALKLKVRYEKPKKKREREMVRIMYLIYNYLVY